MKKLVAISFSDLHINNWQTKYRYDGDRLSDSIAPLTYLDLLAINKGVPLLFSGDLFHKPRSLDSEIIELAISKLSNLHSKIIGIDGNHDQRKPNTHKNPVKGYNEILSMVVPNMTCLTPDIYYNNGNFVVHGIPYLKHNVGFKYYLGRIKKNLSKDLPNILLIHTDLPGAITENGTSLGDVDNIRLNMFKEFDLVLCGHIHKPQVIRKGIVMVGAPYQQNLGDIGQERGYWEIYDDMSYKFIPLNNICPTYKRYNPDNEPKYPKQHIYVPKIKPTSIIKGSTKQFSTSNDRVSIAKAYLKTTKQKDKSKGSLLINLIKTNA